MIQTHYNPKPGRLPGARPFALDWEAALDSYEPGDPVGWGQTEAEAVADLLDQLSDSGQDELLAWARQPTRA